MKAVLPKDRKGAVEDVLATHRGRQSELSHVEVKVRRERAGLQIVFEIFSLGCFHGVPGTMDGASNTNEMMRHTTTVVASVEEKPDGERNDEGCDRKGKNEITGGSRAVSSAQQQHVAAEPDRWDSSVVVHLP